MNTMGPNTQQPQVTIQKTKRRFNGWKLAFIIIIVLLLAGLALVLTGYVTLQLKSANKSNTVATSSTVCDNNLVLTYNKAASYRLDSNNEYVIDQTKVSQIISDFSKNKASQNDPTCQTISLMDAIRQKDKAKATELYAAVKNLYDKGQYANSGLRTDGNYFVFESSVQAIGTDASNKEALNSD